VRNRTCKCFTVLLSDDLGLILKHGLSSVDDLGFFSNRKVGMKNIG